MIPEKDKKTSAFGHGNSSLCHGLRDQKIIPFQYALQSLHLMPPEKYHMLSVIYI